MKTNSPTFLEDYKEIFLTFSDCEIISAFNKEVGVNGWGTARASFLSAIHFEFDRRNIDYSIIGNLNTLSFGCKVRLENKTISLKI